MPNVAQLNLLSKHAEARAFPCAPTMTLPCHPSTIEVRSARHRTVFVSLADSESDYQCTGENDKLGRKPVRILCKLFSH